MIFVWILFLYMTLGDNPIFGFCFRDLPIGVKLELLVNSETLFRFLDFVSVTDAA